MQTWNRHHKYFLYHKGASICIILHYWHLAFDLGPFLWLVKLLYTTILVLIWILVLILIQSLILVLNLPTSFSFKAASAAIDMPIAGFTQWGGFTRKRGWWNFSPRPSWTLVLFAPWNATDWLGVGFKKRVSLRAKRIKENTEQPVVGFRW